MSANVDDIVNASNNSNDQNINHDLNSKNNGKPSASLGGKLLFLLIAILLICYVLFKFFFVGNEKEEVKTITEPDNVVRTQKRNDLGTNFDPIVPPEKEEVAQNATEEKKEQKIDPISNTESVVIEPPKFKKVLAIPHNQAQGSQNQNYTSSSNTVEQQEVQSNSSQTTNKLTATTSSISVNAIQLDPNLYIETNTLIPCAMTTRFVSDVAGRINCVITKDVWSANHKVKLLEAGTKAFGSYQTGTLNHGQGRMFVIWDQLRTPDFKRIDLNETTEAGGELGEGGISGYIDSHFWQRFGGSLMLSMVNDVAAAVADTVPSTDRNVDYTANSRDAIAEMAKVALENSINIPPTMYKNQGDIINIVVGDDIDFSSIYDIKVSGY